MRPHPLADAADRRLRVSQIITRGDEAGGAQQHVAQLASCLNARGWVVDVVAGSHEFFDTELPGSVIRTSIASLRRQIGFRQDLAALKELIGHLRSTEPDLVAAHSAKATVLARLACRVVRRPCVITYHGAPFTEGLPWKSRILGGIVEFSLRRLSRSQIYVSEKDLRVSSRFKINRKLSGHHPNGIPSVPSPGERAAKEVLRILMVARFSRQKDFGSLIRAFASLQAPHSHRLVLVGDGPDRAEMESLAHQLGVGTSVDFLGVRDDVSDLLDGADIFVLSSRYEGAPLTVLEALRAELPVIASDVGDLRSMIVDGTDGLLFPREDVAALAVCLNQLIDNASLRKSLASAGRARFERDFVENQMIDSTEMLYLTLLGRGTRFGTPIATVTAT
jgi:glycosyltransferase involved in cell wall biosynthesis